MIRIFWWLFVTTGIIGFLLITVVSRDNKTLLVGIEIVISSIVILIILHNIELYFEKHKERLNKNKRRLVISILLIVAGAFCLVNPFVDLTQNTLKNIDGILATIGFGYLIVGFFLFPTTA